MHSIVHKHGGSLIPIGRPLRGGTKNLKWKDMNPADSVTCNNKISACATRSLNYVFERENLIYTESQKIFLITLLRAFSIEQKLLE